MTICKRLVIDYCAIVRHIKSIVPKKRRGKQVKNMDKRLLLASPHMSDEGYELEYIQDAFRKNWIAPLGENVNEFEKAMSDYMGKGIRWPCPPVRRRCIWP